MRVHVEPRKQPRQERSSFTVTAILEAAARILEEEGLPAFNTNAIARRAGTSIGSLYQFFPNKDAIILALLLRERERAVQVMRELLVEIEGMEFEDAYLQFIRKLHEHAPAPRLGQLLELEQSRFPPTAAMESLRSEINELNRALLRRHINPQRCNEVQLDTVVRDIMCIVAAMRVGAALHDELDSLDLDLRILRAVRGCISPFLDRQNDLS